LAVLQREADASDAAMDETAVRRVIHEKMSAGALPRTLPPRQWAGPSSWKRKACAACGERIGEGEREIELHVCGASPIYFHPRCHELWRECVAISASE